MSNRQCDVPLAFIQCGLPQLVVAPKLPEEFTFWQLEPLMRSIATRT